METKQTQCHPKPLVNATCLLGEKGCYENGKCHYIGSCEHKVLTKADRIRAMTDEELADWISNFVYEIDSGEVAYSDDTDQWLFWLQQPAEGDA